METAETGIKSSSAQYDRPTSPKSKDFLLFRRGMRVPEPHYLPCVENRWDWYEAISRASSQKQLHYRTLNFKTGECGSRKQSVVHVWLGWGREGSWQRWWVALNRASLRSSRTPGIWLVGSAQCRLQLQTHSLQSASYRWHWNHVRREESLRKNNYRREEGSSWDLLEDL